MPADLTFTKTDHDVFRRIPTEWWDENAAIGEIAIATLTKSAIVARRVSRFVVLGVVERRGGRTLTAKTEIRRIGK